MPTPSNGSEEVENALRVVLHHLDTGLTVEHHSGWAIYKLEDDRIAVSFFGSKGEHLSEELFEDVGLGIQRFLKLVAIAE